MRNVGNLQCENYQNINDTFRQFASDLDEQLDEVGKATLGAIKEACNQRKEKGEIVSAELSMLFFFESRMFELQSNLAAGQIGGER
ncbi:MAG: hypothetical protein NUV31_08755 [Dehalococcoidales bacterium]|nr:hypothetical protein [Dehalococcoidales bacterium]